MKHMRRKRKKKVTFEAAYCISLKKRKISFVEDHFLPQNTKYLKAKKATFEATSFDETYDMNKTTSSEETYDVKKATSFEETYEVKKGKKK